MPRSAGKLRRDALQIWQAGVDAVDSERLVRNVAPCRRNALIIGDESLALGSIGRIAVVGAGKAGAGMAAAVEEALGPRLMEEKQLAGWVNVPADCVRPLRANHAARGPAGGRQRADAGRRRRAPSKSCGWSASLGPEDLCLCLISGGGSALLPAPVEGITLDDKLAVTRHLSAAGANIEQLNTVRKQLSRIKGGGLARACRAGRLVALMISDVLGDPLDVIASGPTVRRLFHARRRPWRCSTALPPREAGISADGVRIPASRKQQSPPAAPTCRVTNLMIGNNATAVDAAGIEAERLGYSPRHDLRHRSRKGRPKTSAATWPRWPCGCAPAAARIA